MVPLVSSAYGEVGLPILIIGTLFYAFIGKRFLPEVPTREPDPNYQKNADFSHVPVWKKMGSWFGIGVDYRCYDFLKNKLAYP